MPPVSLSTSTDLKVTVCPTSPHPDEFQTEPRVLRLERNLRREAAFADGAIHDAAHRIGTTRKGEWKFHDVLDPRRVMGSRQLAASHQHERLANQHLGSDRGF